MNVYYKTARPLWHFLLFFLLAALLVGGWQTEATTAIGFVKAECGAAIIGIIIGILVKIIVEVIG